jgi:hypothetical protein
MKQYTLLRWHCTGCGILHSLIQSPAAKTLRLWTCPVCDYSSLPSQTCKGYTAHPDFGASTTHVMARGKDVYDPRTIPTTLVGDEWNGSIEGGDLGIRP